MSNNYKIVVFVPLTHCDIIRKAMGDAGAGIIGNYRYCSYSTRGIGRFLPTEGAHPHIGEVNMFEEVEEERIETVCSEDKLKIVIAAMKTAHPYEEVAYDIYPLIDEAAFR